MKRIAILVALLGLSVACARPGLLPGDASYLSPAEQCTVKIWEDGDTPLVICNGKQDTVRLLGVDTAESGFDTHSTARGQRQAKMWEMEFAEVIACGKRATDAVRAFCPAGSEVELLGNERDKYDRRLARVVCHDVLINDWLLEQGLAGRYDYPKPPEKPKGCPAP